MNKKLIVFLICTLLIVTSIPMFSATADWEIGDGHKMHFPQLPDPNGWDVDASYVEGEWPYMTVADDWLCSESGPVTDIHFWGSWLNDIEGTIVAFVIAIHADIPADPPSIPYSRPGVTLWERTFYPEHWTIAGPWEGHQGFYHPGEGAYIPENHINYWQYNIENITEPFNQVEGTIYWLAISAIVMPDPDPIQPRWGWKSSLNHWNDDACWALWYELNWVDLYEPPLFEQSLDLAFVITGEEPTNHPPNTPNKLSGPSTGEVNEWLTYQTSTTDPDGDAVRYGLDVNSDGIIDFWSTSYIPSRTTYTINIKFGGPGTYYLRMLAQDMHGAKSGFSTAKVVTITGANDPPNTPATPTGTTTGKTGVSYTYSTSTTDPDGDSVRYGWDWNGDGTVDEWTGFYSSGTTVNTAHSWTTTGTYNVKVKAEDSKGGQSAFSSPLAVTISDNNPPNKPSKPSGPSSGRPDVSYSFSSSTTDPDGDQLYYWFDWDDGTDSGWVGPYTSGQTASASHIWSAHGTYSVKVKVKDLKGAESVWSEPLSITMPKSKISQIPIFQILERFPTIYLILYKIVGFFY